MLASTTQLISLSGSQIFTILFSSVVIATLLGKIIDYLIERWKSNKEKQSKLYKPIKFYLMLLENIDLNRNTLFEETKNGINEIKFENSEAKNNWQEKTNQQLSKMGRPIVEEMMANIEKIKELFESHPSLIEDKHWETIKIFFDGYLKRKMLIAGGWPEEYIHLSQNAHKEWQDAIFKAIKKLKREII